MSRATEELFDALHGLAAQELINEIRAYQAGERYHPTKYDKDGEPLPREPIALPAAIVAQAIKFLKDNGVDRPGRESGALDALADSLPTDEEVENLYQFPGKK